MPVLDSEIAIRWLVSRVKQPTFELGNGVGALGVIGRWLRRRRSDGRGRGVVRNEWESGGQKGEPSLDQRIVDLSGTIATVERAGLGNLDSTIGGVSA
jgi:hypothetical protein